MGDGDGKRHVAVALVGRIAEHDALIAGAHVEVVGRVDAHGDVSALLLDHDLYLAGVGPDALLGLVVAYSAQHFARNALVIDAFHAGNLAADQDELGGGEHLAGDVGPLVARQALVEDRVRDLVADLVGMAFRNRFGGQ